MSAKFVVGLSCTAVKEVSEHRKQLLYTFAITWSDESTSSKEVSSEDLITFRKNLKTEVYASKPDVVIPEVPDGKHGGLITKAKKAEKRKKAIDDFCLQIINLPHIQGKLQAIASQFKASEEDGVTNETEVPTEVKVDRKSKTDKDRKSGNGNGHQPSPNAQTKPDVESENTLPESEYAEVMPDRMMRIPPRSNSKLQYVEIEIIPREKRETREVTSPVYAEVVMLKSSTQSDWLHPPTIDPDDSDDPEEVEKRSPPIVPPRISFAPGEEVKDCHPNPDETEVSEEKAEVHAPEQADEMTDSVECSLVQPPTHDGGGAGKEIPQGIFDAAMMSNFPSRTLIPLPPNHKPKKCPSSSDVKLSKNELPSADVPNICIVAVSGCKSSGENTLPFKRNQRAHLLYTTDVWWFVSTGDSIGWVPADFWRIVTPNSKMVSGKAMPPFAPWNFGVLSRKDCEALLITGNQLDFLVRESANSTGHLVLSAKHSETVRHFGIQITGTGFCYIGQHHFQTIHNVVLYYMKHDLFTDANGNPCRLGRLFVKPKK